jgi:hypothetical protein
MKTIREAADQGLQWKRTKWWKREFALRSGDEVVAILYKERGTGRTIGEASDGRWAFKRRGFLSTDIVITELAFQSEIAVVKRGRKAGIAFSDGRVLAWKKSSFWRDEWEWVDGDGSPLIHFDRGKNVVLEPLALTLPDLSLLVLAGWHLKILQQEEAAASAAVATSV